MSKSLQSYFYIGQSQRRGIVITFAIILAYAVFRYSYIRYDPPFLNDLAGNNLAVFTEKQDEKAVAASPIDINQAGMDQLVRIGLPRALASRLVNFRKKINGFKSWQEVQKVYGLDDTHFTLLKQSALLHADNNIRNIRRNGRHALKRTGEKTATAAVSYRNFDPNTVDASTLRTMGIRENIIRGLINFRKSGFTYRTTDDLRRIYAMDDATMTRIAPYVIISNTESSRNAVRSGSTSRQVIPVDINTATIEQMDQLPGIGPGYAKRILNWRDKLGGFHHPDQVKSTYNLPDSVFEKISPYLRFDTPPRKINVNTADARILAGHFYIGIKEAGIIVSYRDNHGPYRDATDLMKTGAINESWLQKAGPYLSF